MFCQSLSVLNLDWMCFRSLGLGTKSQLTARSGYQPSDHQTNLKLIANSPWKRWKYLVVLLFWKIKLSLKIDWSRKGCYSLPAINKRVYVLLLLFPCTPLGLIVDTASDPIENKYYWGSESYIWSFEPDQSLVLQDSYNSKLFSTTQIVVGGG